MKTISYSFLVSMLLLSTLSYAQSLPEPPASWVAFQKQESEKRSAFFKQLKDDRDAFLSANPDAKAYLEQVRTAVKERRASWISSHPHKATVAN